jgi:hypothetical protein
MTSTVYDWINTDDLEKALVDLEMAYSGQSKVLAYANIVRALGGKDHAPDAIRQLIRDAGIGRITINIRRSIEAHTPPPAPTTDRTRPDPED